MQLAEHAVVARWISQDRCQGYEMQADGVLLVRTRHTPGEMWSPPEEVGFFAAAIDQLQDLLADLTGSHPNSPGNP